MSDLCDPLNHKQDTDRRDLGLMEGMCQVCHAKVTYSFDYDGRQYTAARFGLSKNIPNFDIGTIGYGYQPEQVFAIMFVIADLQKGIYIIPYTMVVVTTLKDGVEKKTNHPLNPTYEKLKSPDNFMGEYTDTEFRGSPSRPKSRFEDGWKKVVLNDKWLKTNFTESWSAINKQYI
jgi:hypothetical protein